MKKLITLMLFLGWGSASGAVVITVVESGGDVVFSTDGATLDMTGLSFIGSVQGNDGPPVLAQVNGFAPQLAVGYGGSNVEFYEGVTTAPAPGEMGTFDFTTLADSATGDFVGVDGNTVLVNHAGLACRIDAPVDSLACDGQRYVGAFIEPGTATYNSSTFASLGLNTGSYLFSWAGDSIAVNVVPIPAAVWLFGSGLGLLGWFRRKKV